MKPSTAPHSAISSGLGWSAQLQGSTGQVSLPDHSAVSPNFGFSLSCFPG